MVPAAENKWMLSRGFVKRSEGLRASNKVIISLNTLTRTQPQPHYEQQAHYTVQLGEKHFFCSSFAYKHDFDDLPLLASRCGEPMVSRR